MEDGFGSMPAVTDKFNNQTNRDGRVVLKHMFTLDELEEDPKLPLDLKEDVKDECMTLGDATNVVVYDLGVPFFCVVYPDWPLTVSSVRRLLQQGPEGMMTVKFRDPISGDVQPAPVPAPWFALVCPRQIEWGLQPRRERSVGPINSARNRRDRCSRH